MVCNVCNGVRRTITFSIMNTHSTCLRIHVPDHADITLSFCHHKATTNQPHKSVQIGYEPAHRATSVLGLMVEKMTVCTF